MDFHGQAEADALALKEEGKALHLAVLAQRCDQGAELGRAHARHLPDPLGLAEQHVQGVIAELLNQAPGQLAADALEEPAAQVTLNARGGVGQNFAGLLHGKLPAIFWMAGPVARQLEPIALSDLEERPGGRYLPLGGLEPGYCIK